MNHRDTSHLGLLDDRQAAKVLGLARKTLQEWRRKGLGPKFVVISMRAIRYKQADLEDFIESRVVDPDTRNSSASVS